MAFFYSNFQNSELYKDNTIWLNTLEKNFNEGKYNKILIDENKWFLVEPANNSIYPDIKSRYKPEKSKCISINDINLWNKDKIYAIIISSNNKTIFSKSNEITINNEK